MALGYGYRYGYSYGLGDPVRLLLPTEFMLPVESVALGGTLSSGPIGLKDSTEVGVGTFVVTLPLLANGDAYSGVRAFSLYDDFYDRFYIKPPVLDFGIVARRTYVPYKVWNARIDPASLTTIFSSDLGPDGVSLQGTTLPYNFAPLEEITHTGVAELSGSTQIDGSYTYIFSPAQTEVVPVTGVRGRLWPFPPNWSSAYRQKLEFKTEILVSRSGKEQRMALRTTPRKSVEFTSHVQADQRRELNRCLDIYQSVDFVVPDIPRYARLASDISAGSIVLPFATMPDWADEGVVIVLSSGSKAALHRIQSVDTGFVTLDDPTAAAWSAGTYVSPGIVGPVDTSIASRRLTNDVAEVSLLLNEKPGYWDYVAPPPAAEIHNGREVVLERPNWATVPTLTYGWETEEVDYGRGVVARFVPIEFGTRLLRLSYDRTDYTSAKALVDVFMRARGRRGEFYMPTWENDLPPKLELTIGDNRLRVAGEDAANAYSGSTVYDRIMVLLNDGTRIYRRIQAVAAVSDAFGDDSVFTLAGTWPATYQPSAVMMVSFLPLCRFASDSLSIDWLTDNKASVQFNIQTLEDQEPESV